MFLLYAERPSLITDKTTGKIIALCILICKFLDRKWEDKKILNSMVTNISLIYSTLEVPDLII
jgi:hypothetical protein